jgi:hypothetical protein
MAELAETLCYRREERLMPGSCPNWCASRLEYVELCIRCEASTDLTRMIDL